MHTTQGIVLTRLFIRDNECLYHIFAREYGRIRVWIKHAKSCPIIDLGSIATFIIRVRNHHNRSREYTLVRSLDTRGCDFRSISNILEILALLSRTLPEGELYPSIFDDYVASVDMLLNPATNRLTTHLFFLKVARTFGILPETSDENAVIARFEHALRIYSFRRVCRIRGVTEAMIETLEQTVSPHLFAFASRS